MKHVGNHVYSQSPVMEEDEDADSDLMPGDESEVEMRRVDVTKPFDDEATILQDELVSGGLRIRREVSFDIDIVGEEPIEKRIPAQKKALQQQHMNSEKPVGIGANKVSKQAGEKLEGKLTPLLRRLKANMVS